MLTARDARRVPRRGPRLGRRRLPRQAVRAPGAARPPARAAAPPAAARPRLGRRRRPLAEPRHPRGPARRARRRAHPARVRAARVPHAQRAHRRPAPAPARGGLGLRPVRDDEHDRGLRVQPAAQARGAAASRGSCTRSGARGTSCVLDRLSIRWKLAGISAADVRDPLRLRRGRRSGSSPHGPSARTSTTSSSSPRRSSRGCCGRRRPQRGRAAADPGVAEPRPVRASPARGDPGRRGGRLPHRRDEPSAPTSAPPPRMGTGRRGLPGADPPGGVRASARATSSTRGR